MTDAVAQGSPRSEALQRIDARLTDLREANEIFRKARWDRSSEIQRNDREIRWMIDTRAILASGLAEGSPIEDELNEIADGAWGDGPAVRGRARDELAQRVVRGGDQS